MASRTFRSQSNDPRDAYKAREFGRNAPITIHDGLGIGVVKAVYRISGFAFRQHPYTSDS